MPKKDRKTAQNNHDEMIRRLNDLQPSKRKSARRRLKNDDLDWVFEMEIALTEDERSDLGLC